jgi:ABC-2 type transport system ATP-binding protein
VLIINHGRLIYDGALSGITEQFGQSKLVRLQFAGDVPANELECFGEVERREGPIAELRVERPRVAEAVSAILDQHTVLDISVEDPPLETMIAQVFEQGRAGPERETKNGESRTENGE